MSSIAELLKEFSQESTQEDIREENIEEGQVGAEEMTVVTDETTTELEEAIEEVADAVEGQEQVAETTETLLDAAESLENAVAQIEELRLSGQRVNAVSMKIWARGVADSMEARQIPAEVYQDLMDDFGTSFESTDTYSDYSTEAEEKGEGIMAKIWNMIKSAFARARDFLARLIGWFGKSADAIIKAGYKLREASKNKKELKNSNAKVNGAPYIELADNGTKVVPSGAIKTAMSIFRQVNEGCDYVYEAAVEGAKQINANDIPDVTGAGRKDAVEEMAKAFTGTNGIQFAGVTVKAEGKVGTSWFNNGKITLKLKTTKNTTAPAKEQTPLTPAELSQLADDIIKCGEDIKTVMSNAKRTQGKIVIDFPKKDDGKHAVEKMSRRRELARVISSMTSVASSVRSSTSSRILSMAKKAYVYGMANVRMYK